MGTGPDIDEVGGNNLSYRLFIDCFSSGGSPIYAGTDSLIYGDQSGVNRNQLTFNADVTIDSGNRASIEGSLNIVSSKIHNGNLGDVEQIMKVSSDGSKLEWSTPDFTSEAYVNSLSFGLTSKGTCKAATTENLYCHFNNRRTK